MTTKKFSNALGNIGEKYVDEAVTYTAKKKANPWVKRGAIAACLSLIVMVGIFGNLFRSPDTPDVPENNIMSYFAITAYAANGESTDLTLTNGCLSSVPGQQENILGVDMPLFHFDVKPSDLKSNEVVYQRFYISISYNGTPVKDKDEHISVAYLAYVQSSQTCGYSIFGWFTEPTDVVVTITDKESKAVVEEITVNVKYYADRKEYELKLTNLDTEYAK